MFDPDRVHWPMKVVIAMLKHETNTFSSVPTQERDFGPAGPLTGAAAIDTFRNSGLAMAGLIQAAERIGAEIETPIAARALPSGPVSQCAFDHMAMAISQSVRAGCDALFLDLHGAMVTAMCDDGDGELLMRVRKAVPDLPIAVALDFHANITARMVENSTVIVGYKTYPHIDMVETGRRAGELLLEAIAGRIRPVLAHLRCPLLPNILCQATSSPPMAELMAAARKAEAEGALAVSVFGGFPLADTPDTGLGVVAMVDRAPERADRICRNICDLAWARRESFVARFEPLAESIARARSIAGRPILLVDTADNCHSGGTQDTMAVIAEALAQGLDEIAAGPVCDPEAVARMAEAGIGASVTLPIGGKSRLASLERQSRPLVLSGVVRTIADSRFTVEGPVFTGMRSTLGRCAVLDTGPLRLIASEGRMEPLDLAMFRSVDIEPTAARFLIIKSKVQYKPTFGAIAKHVIDCNGTGVASADYRLFRFRKLGRPIYPLDPAM